MLSKQDVFINSGWWHDNRILGATGQGIEVEEPRAWEGSWNEKIVELVRLTAKQPDALCVLLTGRSEERFAELIIRIVASKRLEFDMVCLKPQVGPANQKFSSTMKFKQELITELMETYKHANEIRIYEDRPKHTQGFRDFLDEFNQAQAAQPTRGPINADVVQVTDTVATLNPVAEVAEVQRMINEHNEAMRRHPIHLRPNALRIKKTVFFTSYGIQPEDAQRLLGLVSIPQKSGDGMRIHGNNIIIVPRPCTKALLAKVGGIGARLTWQVTGTGCYQNSIWAACVSPVPASATFHTDNPVPIVVLALKKGARPADANKITSWTALPPEKRFAFETTVGEKAILRVEAEDPREDEYGSLFANSANNNTNGGGAGSKRKHNGDDWNPPKQPSADTLRANAPNGPSGRGGRNGRGGRGGGQGGRGGGGAGGGGGQAARGGGGGRGRGKGKGARAYYRSLDDVGPKTAAPEVSYDDAHPPANAPTGPRSEMNRQSGSSNNVTDLQDYY